MNFLMQDFLMAVSNSSYRRKILHKKKNLTKKEVDYLNFEVSSEKKGLRKDLAQAEQLYNSLEGKVTKRKLSSLKRKINSLKKKLEDDKITQSKDFVQYKDSIITPPLIEDLNYEIDALDEDINLPEDKVITKEQTNAAEQNSKVDLLKIPPPPKKAS